MVVAGMPVSEIVVSDSEQSSFSSSTMTGGSNNDGVYICLKVKDVLGMTAVDLKRFVYPPDTTFKKLFDDVSLAFNMSVEDFDLTYQEKMDMYELSAMPMEEKLTAANLHPSRQREYALTLTTRSRKNKKKYIELIAKNLESSFDLAATSKDGAVSDEEVQEGTGLKFVGLKNRTMTCYLNSAVQGLWFTPQFRNLIYSFVALSGTSNNKKSICYPLQKIFLLLQFSTRDAIETDELTRTFGWTDRDTWQQHDIQELCSLLMEMLIVEFKSTPQDGVIQSLYYGCLMDYVKCLKCNNFNDKPEEFLVLPLPIRKPNREPLDEPTLEEALKTFTMPELLEGNNQYKCEPCGTSVDAHKGYMFKKLPCIFSVQLKRFDNDWETNRRYKLNDKIVFPVALDMNKFIDKSELKEQLSDDSSNLKLLVKPCIDADLPRTKHSRPGVLLDDPNSMNSKKDEHDIDLGSSRDVVVKTLQRMRDENGPNVYELFGVFVHRGGLAGGHYYAFIKDFETYRWYRCDDSMVRKARVDDVKATFGCSKDTEQMSAYMLMYRRYDETNILPFLKSQLPPHILSNFDALMESDVKEKENDVIEKNTFKMIVKHKPYNTWDVHTGELIIPKSLTAKEVALLAFKHFFPEFPDPPSDHIRLCRYDLDLGITENSFVDDQQVLTQCLKNPPPKTKDEALILEVRNENDIFTRYSADDIIFITLLSEHASGKMNRWEELHAEGSLTVGDLRKTISNKWNIVDPLLQIALQSSEIVILLDDDTLLLSSINLSKINRLFVEVVPQSDVQAWIEFATNFIHTAVYNIEVQHLPPSYPGGNEFFNLDGIDIRFEVTCIRLEVPSPRVDVDMSTESCSTLSPESEFSYSPSSSPCDGQDSIHTKNLAVDSVNENDLGDNTIMKFTASANAMKNDWIALSSHLDCRITLATVSKGLEKVLLVPETNFCLFHVRENEEIEITNYNIIIQKVLGNGGSLRVRFCQRLKPTEGRVAVFVLNLKDLGACGNYIGDVIFSPDMTVVEAKQAVLEQCSDALPASTVNCRLRKKFTPERVSKVLRDNTPIREWLPKIHDVEIYLQLLESEAPLLDRDTFSVMARVWRPNALVLELPIEFTIFHDHSNEVSELILEKLIGLTQIPKELLEVARVEFPFPYALNPVGIQELDWFSLESPSKKPLYLYNDELVVFARNKSEILKGWTLEEEIFYKKQNEKEQNGGTSPRREVGIKINLNLSKSPTGSANST